MSLTADEVTVCNQMLDIFGEANFTFANQATDLNGKRCDRHYEQTRKELLRSHDWPFAMHRLALAMDTTVPVFEWDYRYKLPIDFLRIVRNKDGSRLYSGYDCIIEGKYLLTNDDGAKIRYVKNITNPNDFDPLFSLVLRLTLADKLKNTIVGLGKAEVKEQLQKDLKKALLRASAVCRQQNDNAASSNWNDARFGSGIY